VWVGTELSPGGPSSPPRIATAPSNPRSTPTQRIDSTFSDGFDSAQNHEDVMDRTTVEDTFFSRAGEEDLLDTNVFPKVSKHPP
jgi:hypothetical protein